MARRRIEEQWPHGRRFVTEQEDETMTKFLNGVALSAKTSGLLDQGPAEVVKTLKNIIMHPADLLRELRRMSASAGRAKASVQQIRKEL